MLSLSKSWSTVRFSRSLSHDRSFTLYGIPEALFERICSRLFVLGARYVSSGADRVTRYYWIAFEASLELAGKLAQVFPTQGQEPLLISPKNGRLLTGAAVEKAWKRNCKDVIVQRSIGQTSELTRSRGEQLALQAQAGTGEHQ